MSVIEIIDQYGERHRFPAEDYAYEWRLKPGTMDIEGTEFVDIRNDENEIVATFPNPAKAGLVTETTALLMPMRELRMKHQCPPRCGLVTNPDAKRKETT